MIFTATLSQPGLSLPALRPWLAAAAALDAVFFVAGSPPVPGFDPLVVVAALAGLNLPIGLGGGVAIDFSEPFHVARSFAAIDRLTKGRSALVIDTAGHFVAGCGHTVLPADPAARRREFFDVVVKLWDSWEDEALLVDRPAGLFTDPARIHRIDHDGTYYAVRGPLNAPRPLQGAPVIVAPAEVEPRLAAAVADVVLVDGSDVDALRHGCAALRNGLAAAGRSRDAVRILADIAPAGPAALIGAWHAEGLCDGFNVRLPADPAALAWVEAAAAGLARPSPAGGTLRERLGLARPRSRFAA